MVADLQILQELDAQELLGLLMRVLPIPQHQVFQPGKHGLQGQKMRWKIVGQL